jgi:hypothetical protein
MIDQRLTFDFGRFGITLRRAFFSILEDEIELLLSRAVLVSAMLSVTEKEEENELTNK